MKKIYAIGFRYEPWKDGYVCYYGIRHIGNIRKLEDGTWYGKRDLKGEILEATGKTRVSVADSLLKQLNNRGE